MMISISTIDLAAVTGGAGTGFEPAGTSCTADKRNTWQKVAPTLLGGRANPTCTTHPARVWFSKDALDGGEVGQRQLTPDAAHDLGNLTGKL
jgi:hypothetical protein